ncbi:hypothetical protein Zm00014a_007956 [Zea mays]|uniref:MAPK kinase substrate protein n=1 Tax=Zea mays TaxID=4577 RepID=A0A3L6DCE0_MAIZE|nr:hypothetical protein Zm00014a_007956 [Zea mays]
MAGLQRSATTFRRSGSSGLVWDERFLTEAEADADAEAKAGAAEDAEQPELRHSRSVGMLRRAGGGGDSRSKKGKESRQKQAESARRSNQQVFRTKDVAPDMDPPSPRVSGCAFCAVFRGGSGGTGRRAQARRRSKPRKK